MNCPSRTEEAMDEGWNQSPSALAADLTTRSDLNGIANLRLQRDHLESDAVEQTLAPTKKLPERSEDRLAIRTPAALGDGAGAFEKPTVKQLQLVAERTQHCRNETPPDSCSSFIQRSGQILLKFSKFIGPGFMVSVAYIDPGNYSTDVAAGASDRFKLLFIVLLSNIFAIVLQTLAVRLGTVTGLNLAEHCRIHLPKWLNIFLYILAEAAIIATDIAEVWRMDQRYFTSQF